MGQACTHFLSCQVTAHWEKFMASKSPEEATEKAQAEFVSSAVQDVHFGPESLREFTQWRVSPVHPSASVLPTLDLKGLCV